MQIKSGTTAGTGATINITCGFVPNAVWIYNTTGNAALYWNSAMADASGVKQSAGTISLITTLGITPTDPNGSFIGFSIGADTDVNVSEEALKWTAIGDV